MFKAYKLVKVNAGSAGIDRQSLRDFEENLKDNLYKIWNRLSSGSYFPPPVKGVDIPKKSGGKRTLGIPTVSDRIAQMVVKMSFEPIAEPHFLNDSYGYRPNKSALDAVAITRKRCWKYTWVLEFDIKGLFDNIPHDLLMKAVKHHTKEKWLILYIERWLTAPLIASDGKSMERTKGTPQGGVISPILSNLFLHYVFDKWMQRRHPSILWCRYADDGLCHCFTEAQAFELKEALAERFEACGLQMHPDKTRIVYCKSWKFKGRYKYTSFDFLGYTFKPKVVKTKDSGKYLAFTPSVSQQSLKTMRAKIRSWRLKSRTELTIEDIARYSNPVLRAWREYYGKFSPSSLVAIWRYFNMMLVRWIMNKYKQMRRHKTRAGKMLASIMEQHQTTFIHWKEGVGKSLA